MTSVVFKIELLRTSSQSLRGTEPGTLAKDRHDKAQKLLSWHNTSNFVLNFHRGYLKSRIIIIFAQQKLHFFEKEE